MSGPPGLAETLAMLAPDLATLTEDWWLIGSAAMVLHGLLLPTIGDIDVLTTPAGARELGERWGCDPTETSPSVRFRSSVFLRRSDAPLPVEVMAGFEVRTPRGWTGVSPQTRVALPWGDHSYFAPSKAELLEILALFGRPQDLARAEQLSAIR